MAIDWGESTAAAEVTPERSPAHVPSIGNRRAGGPTLVPSRDCCRSPASRRQARAAATPTVTAAHWEAVLVPQMDQAESLVALAGFFAAYHLTGTRMMVNIGEEIAFWAQVNVLF